MFQRTFFAMSMAAIWRSSNLSFTTCIACRLVLHSNSCVIKEIWWVAFIRVYLT